MTLNERDLHQWEVDNHILLTSQQKAIALDTFGSEPEGGFTWSEQDIAETIRKICRDYPAPEKPLPDFLRQKG